MFRKQALTWRPTWKPLVSANSKRRGLRGKASHTEPYAGSRGQHHHRRVRRPRPGVSDLSANKKTSP